jgi:hypothetical protein
VFSAIRGFGFGAGQYRIVGIRFAVAFALLITIGQILAYSRGMRPPIDYVVARRSRLTRRQFWGTVIRTFGYIASSLVCSAFIPHDRKQVLNDSGTIEGTRRDAYDSHSFVNVLLEATIPEHASASRNIRGCIPEKQLRGHLPVPSCERTLVS